MEDNEIPIITNNKELWTPNPHDFFNKGLLPIFHLVKRYISEAKTEATEAIRTATILHTPIDNLLDNNYKLLLEHPLYEVKQTDKGQGIWIGRKSDYELMCLQHLESPTYLEVDSYNPQELIDELTNILKRFNKYYEGPGTKRLTKLAKSLLQIKAKDVKTALFYCAVKTLKQKILFRNRLIYPGRPIAASVQTHSTFASKYLHNRWWPMLEHLEEFKTILRSTHDLILWAEKVNEDIRAGRRLPFTSKARLFKADITSMYSNIPTHFGMMAARVVLYWVKDKMRWTDADIEFDLQLLFLVLTTNYVEFAKRCFLQLSGTAMGTNVAPTYANLVIFYMEVLYGPRSGKKPIINNIDFYFRLIDDSMGLNENETETHAMANFVTQFNSICPGLNFDPSSVEIATEIEYLDVKLYFDNGLIGLRNHHKNSKTFLYICPTSFHAKSVFPSWITGEFKRLRLNCTDDTDYAQNTILFYNSLRARGYTLEMINAARRAVPSRQALIDQLKQGRAHKQLSRENTTPRPKKRAPVLTVTLPKLKAPLPLGSYGREPLNELMASKRWRDTYQEQRIIIGKGNNPTAANKMIRAQFRPEQTTTTTPEATTQTHAPYC